MGPAAQQCRGPGTCRCCPCQRCPVSTFIAHCGVYAHTELERSSAAPCPARNPPNTTTGSVLCLCSPRQSACASARHRPAAAPMVVSPASPAISTRSGDSSAPGMREGAGGREAWRTHGTGDSERHAPPHVTDPAGLYVSDLTLPDWHHALCGRQPVTLCTPHAHLHRLRVLACLSCTGMFLRPPRPFDPCRCPPLRPPWQPSRLLAWRCPQTMMRSVHESGASFVCFVPVLANGEGVCYVAFPRVTTCFQAKWCQEMSD